MKIKPGDLVKSWAIDSSQGNTFGVVLRETNASDKSLPPFWEILWKDGTVAGEFEDELGVILNEEQANEERNND